MSACLSSRKVATKVDWESRRDIIQIAKEKWALKQKRVWYLFHFQLLFLLIFELPSQFQFTYIEQRILDCSSHADQCGDYIVEPVIVGFCCVWKGERNTMVWKKWHERVYKRTKKQVEVILTRFSFVL